MVSYSSEGRVPAGTAVLVLDEEGRFPLLRRQGAHAAGTWCPPGGWVDRGEDPAEAASRECWEEVGISVPPDGLEFLGYTRTRYDGGVESVCLWFLAPAGAWSGTPRNTYPDRASELRWSTWDDLPGPLMGGFADAIRKGLVGG